MESLILIGALISVLGILGLVWCILYVLKLRRMGLEDAEMRVRMQKAVMMNFAALAVSTIGLMVVIVGIFLA